MTVREGQTASLSEDILAMREVFNFTTSEAVLGEMSRGNPAGAGELLCQEAAIHESCLNQGTADAFYELAERL